METEIIRKIISEVMNVDPNELTGETTFIEDLGADSLDNCRILMKIEEEFRVIVPKESLYKVNSMNDIKDLLNEIKVK